jgi:octopine/nopaline transport system ATP-binding protein
MPDDHHLPHSSSEARIRSKEEDMSKNECAIRVEDLHKRFGSNEVLKGVSLSANKGDVISMIGSSGSGKSTLLRCINLLEIPDRGKVYIDGELIRMKKKGEQRKPADNRQVDRIRQQLGMVFQDFNLWEHMTVLENIIEAPVHVLKQPKAESVEKAKALLDKVGLNDKHKFYPNQLSGGQQQRVAIARALAIEPKALLFDEPTSALDPELVGEVLRVIRALAEEGRTMLIVTHEIGFAREVSSHTIFLHEGIVEEEGRSRDVIDNPVSPRCRQFLSQTFGKE